MRGTEVNTKDFILSMVLFAALSFLFSTTVYAPEAEDPHGAGTQFLGESGMVVPGEGMEPVTATIPPESQAAAEARDTEPAETAAPDLQVNIINKMEETTMNEIIVAFWHGAGAILLGEVAALLMAAAWQKIKAAREG